MDLAQLQISVDSRPAANAASDLDRLATAGGRAKAAIGEVQSAATASGRELREVSNSSNAAAEAQLTAARAGQQLLASLREQIQTFGKGSADVLRYRAAQLGVGEAAAPLILQLQNQRAAHEQAAAAAMREAQAQREAAAAKRATETSQQNFLAGLREQIDLQGKSAAEVLRYRAAQLGVSAQAETYIGQIERSATSTGKLGLSAAQTAQAMRLLPAQITDIVTSLASGSPAYLVAIQQGGQIKDSFGGIGNAVKALGSVLTPTRLLLGATVGTAALLAKAFYDGQRESFEFAKSITLSGNAAGVTLGQLAAMARGIDGVVGTQRAAASTLAALVSTGRVASRDLEQFATIAQRLERTAGVPVKEFVADLAELGRRPVEAAAKLNEQFNFLTVATYKQIKALEEQGRIFDAGELAQLAYARAMNDRAQKLETQLGTLQRVARSTGSFFSEMWDSILAVGRPVTLDDQIAAVQQRIREISAGVSRLDDDDGFGGVSGGRERAIALLREQERALRAEQAAQDAAARSDAERKRALDKYIASQRDAVKVTQARREANDALAQTRLEIDTNAIRRALDASLQSFGAYEASLKALRSAGMVSAQTYFDAQIALIERETDARLRAIRDERARVAAELQRVETAFAASSVGSSTIGPGGSRRTRTAASRDEAERLKAEVDLQRQTTALQERIAALDAQSASVSAKRAQDQSALNIELQTTAELSRRILEDARATAQTQLDLISRQRQRQIDALGQGGRQRERNAGLAEIEDRYADELRRLEDQKRRGDFKDRENEYVRLLALAREYRDRDLADFETYWQKLEDKQGSFMVGAREAFANYLDDARNVAEKTRDAFERAFDSAADAAVQFARTGKVSVHDLIDSILADMLRVKLQAAIGQVAGLNWGGFLAGVFGNFTPSGGIGAGGGSVPTGPARSAARGEMRVPRDGAPYILHKDEAVLPRDLNPWAGGKNPFGGGMSLSLHSEVNVGAGVDAAQFQAALDANNAQLIGTIAENMKRGRWDGVTS